MKYSVVIPLKNEEGNIAELIAEIEPVMTSLKAPWELLCIDDGSTDKTWEILTALTKGKPFLRLIAFDKNYGQSCAFDAGFRLAKGNGSSPSTATDRTTRRISPSYWQQKSHTT